MTARLAVSVTLAIAITGCSEKYVGYPDLCALEATAYAPAAPSCDKKAASVSESETVFVLQRLPENMVSPGTVRFRLQSACAAVERDVEYNYNEGIQRYTAVDAFEVPAGASCGLVITATLGSQTQRTELPGTTCNVSCPAGTAGGDASSGSADGSLGDGGADAGT